MAVYIDSGRNRRGACDGMIYSNSIVIRKIGKQYVVYCKFPGADGFNGNFHRGFKSIEDIHDFIRENLGKVNYKVIVDFKND